MDALRSNGDILSVCRALLADDELDADERELVAGVAPASDAVVRDVVAAVLDGGDPLGDAFMRVNDAEGRRSSGSVYTPEGVVGEMVGWSADHVMPERVVDCGCGSGRFAVACARRFPDAEVIAVDLSAEATLMCRATARAAGVRVRVVLDDFTRTDLVGDVEGPTLWIGNPPYVRHHGLSQGQKARYQRDLRHLGVSGSALAGLHCHFVATIARWFADGDLGCLILPAEWMDVGYGSAVREILTGVLPLVSMTTYDKCEQTFAGTMSSAVVVGFSRDGGGPEVTVNGHALDRARLAASSRWSDVLGGRSDGPDDGLVRLGSIAQVHRGVVTGSNSFWVRRPGEVSDGLTVPVVAHARELSGDRPVMRDVGSLSRLITLPEDISELSEDLRDEALAIIDDGLRTGVDEGFIASHRRCWWSIGAPKTPAIMMTYMARHAPTFVVNSDGLGMLNVVHGIYPTVSLSEHAIESLAAYLNANVDVSDGRCYSGGLTKFEPREVERLMVPSPEMLEAM